MSDLDAHLRAAAHAWLDAEADAERSRTDLDAALADVISPSVRSRPPGERNARARRWAVAACVVALVGGAVAFVATLDGDGELGPSTLPATVPSTEPDVPTPTVPTSTLPGTTTVPDTTDPVEPVDDTLATANPAEVTVGAAWTIIVTPSAPVDTGCSGVLVLRDDTGLFQLGAVGSDGSLAPYDPVLDSACDAPPSDLPVQGVLPATVTEGELRLCIGPDEAPEGCATVTVVVASDEPATTGVSPVPYLVRRQLATVDPVSGLPFELRDIAPDGTDLGRSTADVVQLAGFPADLGTGISMGLSTNDAVGPVDGRCRVQGIGVRGAPDAVGVAPTIPGGSSMVGNGNRIVVARDVCPDGTRWGDPGTFFELVAYDPSLPEPEGTTLTTIEPDPSKVLFDDGTVVYSTDELVARSISPSGAFVSVLEPLNTEDWRWHVYRTDVAGGPVVFGSSCESPGDIVGRPAFPSDDVVVLARRCSGAGGDDLYVEAVSLDDLQPIWSQPVEGVEINSYTQAVDGVSATDVGDELWVIVASSGGVEQPVRAALVNGDDEIDITRGDGFDVQRYAFTAAELVDAGDADS